MAVESKLNSLSAIKSLTKVQNLEKGIALNVKKSVNLNIDEAETKLQEVTASIESTEAEAERITKFKSAMEKLVQSCNKYIVLTNKLANIKFVRNELIRISKIKYSSYDKMKLDRPGILSYSTMKSDFIEFTEYYAKASSLYDAAKLAAVTNEDRKLVAEALAQFEEGHKKISEDDFLKIIDDVSILQKAMDIENCFYVVSPPIQMDGDFVAFNVKISPDPINNPEQNQPAVEFPIEIPAKQGWKADFSVGPVFSFGTGSKDHVFHFTPESGDPTKGKLTKEMSPGIMSPSIAAMIHAYPRSGENQDFGFMMGIGAGFKSDEDIRSSYFIGASWILGKRQKIMVSGGLSFLRVDRLKSNYSTDTTYIIDNIDLSSVTDKYYQRSYFLSVSYNITNRTVVK